MLNQVTLIGRLGADPEVKSFDSGNKVATMNVASWENYWDKNKDNGNGGTGAWQTVTEWHRVVMWGNGADKCEHMKKGDLVMVTGKLKTRQWEDKNGNTNYTTEVVGFVKSMPKGTGQAPGGNQAPANYSDDNAGDEPGDDLPF